MDKADGGYWAFLKDAGFVVVSVNYRLASAETHFPAMIEDLKCAIRHLRTNASTYSLDAQHIGVIGWSAGGHLAALLGTADESAGWDQGEYLEQSSRVQAVVSISGLSDLTRPMYADLSQSIAFAFGEAGGTSSASLAAASPLSHITSDDPPFFIIHGSLDPIVNFDQSQILHAWLTAAGVPSTFVQVEGGDHHLRDENASLTMEQIKVMVKEWLMQVLMAP
jgi:acetyl esterase/lipase